MLPEHRRRPSHQCVQNYPRLWASKLKQRGAMMPGRVTSWRWENLTRAPRNAKVLGGGDHIEIEFDSRDPVRIEVRLYTDSLPNFVCPSCGSPRRYVVLVGDQVQ